MSINIEKSLINLIVRNHKALTLLLVAAFLCSTSKAFTLICTYSLNDVWKLTNLYICDGTLMGSEESRGIDSVTSVFGHLPGYNDAKVQALIIQGRFLHFMPTNVNVKFPAIESLTYSGLHLEAVESSDLDVFPSLKQLDLSNNAIQTINRNIFSGNPIIEAINLSQNPIKHIAHYVFDNLPVLGILEINDSGCIDAVANATNLDAVRFSVFLKCPPTSTMIGDEVLDGTAFKSIIALLQDKIDDLEERIAELEP